MNAHSKTAGPESLALTGDRALSMSKIRVPTLPVNYWPRPDLERQMAAGSTQSLRLLCAPPGFGKTCAAVHQAAALDPGSTYSCWLSLDSGDGDQDRFLSYLYLSLEQGTRGLIKRPDPMDQSGDLRPHLDALVNSIAAVDRPIQLALDGLDFLSRECIDELLLPLVWYAPKGFSLVATTRGIGHLPTARLESHGVLQRITAADLRFGLDDTAAFLAMPAGSGDAVDAYQITRGWPVALGLLNVMLGRDRDIRRLLHSLGRRDDALARFIDEELLDRLTPEAYQFLEAATCLEQPTVGGVDYLLDRSTGASELAELSRCLDGLVTIDESDGEVFVLAPLLRVRLEERLRSVPGGRYEALQLATSTWCHEQQDLIGAVRHAMLAEEPAFGGELILRAGGISLWLREGISRIRTALNMLPAEVIESNQRLLLLQSVVNIKEGRVADAVRSHNRARKLALGDGGGSDLPAPLKEELALTEAYVAIYAGRRIDETSYRYVLESTERLRGLDDERLAFHCNILCVMNTQSGDFTAADRFANDAINLFQEIDSLYGETYIYFHAGDMRFATGDGKGAEANYRRGLKLVRRHFRDDKGMRLVGYTLLIELLDELGRSDYSDSILWSLPSELEAREAWFEIYAAGYSAASNIELRRNGIAAACRILDRGEKYAEQQRLNSLQELLGYQRINLLVQAGLVSEARARLDHIEQGLDLPGRSSGESSGWRALATRNAALASLLLAESRAEEALREIDSSARRSEKLGHRQSTIRYSVLQALALWQLGKVSAALHSAREALKEAYSSGFIRALLDAGPSFDEMLAAIESEGVDPAIGDFFRTLTMRRKGDCPGGQGGQPGEALSERELAIMAHVAEGKSNKQVARVIGISENTVRFHLKNVFRKLRVHNRREAVRILTHRGMAVEST